jgi:hypothetical protein
MKQKCLLLVGVLIFCLGSCKKDSKAPNSDVSIIGKWFSVTQNSELFYNGAQIKAITKTNFTTDDFVEYYSDGTGYFSKSSTPSPSLTEFTYTLKGTTLTQYASKENAGILETITILTASNLTIHAESSVVDPNNSDQVDTEIDDFTYSR